MFRTTLYLLMFFSLVKSNLFGTTHGRLDVAPVAMRVKIQESGKTIETLDMVGGRVDGTFQLVDGYGVVLKPFFFGASGGGDLVSGGCSIGHYTPISDKWTITPLLGWTYSNLKTTIDLPAFGLTGLREKFKSNSFNLGFEAAYQFWPDWYLTGVYQYGFAHTNTKIGSLLSSKGKSEGSSFALILDYYLKCNWVITGAFAYNNSLSKEKHGIEGYGFKAGIGYWY